MFLTTLDKSLRNPREAQKAHRALIYTHTVLVFVLFGPKASAVSPFNSYNHIILQSLPRTLNDRTTASLLSSLLFLWFWSRQQVLQPVRLIQSYHRTAYHHERPNHYHLAVLPSQLTTHASADSKLHTLEQGSSRHPAPKRMKHRITSGYHTSVCQDSV